MEPGARKAARDAELRPLMEDFGGMGAGQLPLASPKLALHRALQYAVEFWPYVMNVLEDGHLELSNNVCFASMFVRQVRQCFSVVWADGFPRCRHRFPVM
ncbi:IS66 family transposase [Bifidobacterium longum]|uniref:IS66 family transposase n=1 Tax=Bifidobacterium longum TaxID=216816 RepID=UPI00374FD20C